MSEPINHRVRVEVDHGETNVTFTCDAPADAPCRYYPDKDLCDCEMWSDRGGRDYAGHPFKAGQPCWLLDWFDTGAVAYEGQDATDEYLPPAAEREAPILTSFDGDCVMWSWAEATE